MTEDSTNRSLITIMIVIGIIIIILLVTGGYFGRSTLAYNTNGSLYAASALPFGTPPAGGYGQQGVVYNNGYPVVTRTVPTGYTAPTTIGTSSSGSSSTTTTTYNTYPATTTVTPATTTTYPVTYPITQSYYPYSNTTYYPSNNYYPTNNGYYPTAYNNSCPTDTMVCSDGMVVGRAGPYCAFTLCQ